MIFYLYFTSLCLGIVADAPQLDQTLDAKWHQWKSQHRKTYGGDEEIWRKDRWDKNLRMIEMHNREYNAGKHSFQLEMNKFGALTNEEFRQMMNGFRQNRFQKKTKGTLFHEPLLEQIPKSLDWRDEGYGQCGSCWAFSTTGSLEGQWFHKTGKLVSLSEQNLVDCSWDAINHGCDGGLMDNAFQYVKKNGGIDTEESYPYEGKDGYGRYQSEHSGANVTGYVDIPHEQESALTKAVATVGPVSVAVDAGHPSFQFYQSGVYYEPECSSQQLDHGVLVVGYGVDTESGEKYWIVKNSWGEAWGKSGYIFIASDKNNHCGIATVASYPEV